MDQSIHPAQPAVYPEEAKRYARERTLTQWEIAENERRKQDSERAE